MSAIRVIDQRLEREKQSGKFLYKVDEFLDTELTLVRNVTATTSVWVSACIVILSSILYITAFATTGWGEVVDKNGFKREHGLWKYCGSNSVSCSSVSNSPGPHIAYQVFAVLSLISLFTSVVVLILYCIYDHMKTVTVIRSGVFFTRVTSAVFLLVTFSVFSGTWYKDKYNGPDYTTSLSYSFALTVTTFVFECIASVLMGIEMRNHSLEMKIREMDRRGLSNSSENSPERQYNQVNHYSDDVANAPKPFELFREFTQEETSNSIDSVNTSKYYDLSPNTNVGQNQSHYQNKNQMHNSKRYDDVRPKTYSEIKPHQNNYSTDISTRKHYASDENIYNEIDNTHPPVSSAQGNAISVHADIHLNSSKETPVRPSRKSKTYSASSSNRHESAMNSYENIPDGKAESVSYKSDSSRNKSDIRYQNSNPYVNNYGSNDGKDLRGTKANYYNQEQVNTNVIRNDARHKSPAYDNRGYQHQERPGYNGQYYNESNT